MLINPRKLVPIACLVAMSSFASSPARSDIFAEDGDKIYSINLETGVSTFYADLPTGWDAWGPDMYGNSDSIVYKDYATGIVKYYDDTLGRWIERESFKLIEEYNSASVSAKDLKSLDLNGNLINSSGCNAVMSTRLKARVKQRWAIVPDNAMPHKNPQVKRSGHCQTHSDGINAKGAE